MKAETKKTDPWLIAIIALILLVPVLYGGWNLLKNKEEVDPEKDCTEVVFDEYLELLEGDPFVLILGTETCPHCIKFKETAKKIVNAYGIDIYYLDVERLTKEQSAKLNSKIVYKSTPTTVVISDGEEYNRSITRIEGNLSYTQAVEKLKKANIIKE